MFTVYFTELSIRRKIDPKVIQNNLIEVKIHDDTDPSFIMVSKARINTI